MIEGCYGYRLLCQIDEIFHSLNAELTAAVVYPEQLSHPLDPGQKQFWGLCYDSYRAGIFSADFGHSLILGHS